MQASHLLYLLILLVFSIGYLAIIFEYYIKVNKTAVALFVAVVCWGIFFYFHPQSMQDNLVLLGKYLGDISQIIFFLIGAMTLVELIDSHRGFKIITDLIRTTSQRKLLWIISLVTFVLSAILDNLTTTILMVSLLRKIIPVRSERILLACVVVIAANAGGAWTPIGDVTTTMLWINGQISTLEIMKALFLPSLISLIVPLIFYTFTQKGHFSQAAIDPQMQIDPEPGGKLVFYMGVGALIFVPVFKALTGLPPYMGVLIGLACLWLVTDILHHPYEKREHLRVPVILTRIDTSAILFFLGILLCINALEATGILHDFATFLSQQVENPSLIALIIGLISAIVDNVPLVAATMGMYPLTEFPMDSSFWHLIAYAAGTGGSLLLIGSSSGVALMGMEKIDFFAFMKRVTLPALVGYFIGAAVQLIQL